ncbi:MAG: hypothetical protein R6V19_01935 [Armatimonadota bacterium]
MAAGNSYPEGGDRVPFLSDIKSMPLMLQRQRTSTGSVAVIAGIFAFLIPVCVPVTAHACDVPVYQYALENWEAEEYEVVVFHRGRLSKTERKAVELLHGPADCGNVIVTTVDLDDNPDALMLQRWRRQETPKLPWMAAWYPHSKHISRPAWAGPLNGDNVRALLNSPLRQKMADQLAGNVTAVWILLESGDPNKDDAAAAVLDEQLRRLEKTLELPVPQGWGEDDGENQSDPVTFTMHRLSRDSAKERMLVDMLMHSESDLATDFAREPLVFPIYGRGLILYALAGPGINEYTITRAAEFMTGACSCEVKAGNPGTDMLMTVDWDAHVPQIADESIPPPTGIASFQEKAAEAKRLFAEVERAHSHAVGDETEGGGAARTDRAQENDDSDAIAAMQGDDDADTGGRMQPGLLLAIVAAGAITIALTAATVLRRRGEYGKDKEHERIST